jgi:hypothetical protein
MRRLPEKHGPTSLTTTTKLLMPAPLRSSLPIAKISCLHNMFKGFLATATSLTRIPQLTHTALLLTPGRVGDRAREIPGAKALCGSQYLAPVANGRRPDMTARIQSPCKFPKDFLATATWLTRIPQSDPVLHTVLNSRAPLWSRAHPTPALRLREPVQVQAQAHNTAAPLSSLPLLSH